MVAFYSPFKKFTKSFIPDELLWRREVQKPGKARTNFLLHSQYDSRHCFDTFFPWSHDSCRLFILMNCLSHFPTKIQWTRGDPFNIPYRFWAFSLQWQNYWNDISQNRLARIARPCWSCLSAVQNEEWPFLKRGGPQGDVHAESERRKTPPHPACAKSLLSLSLSPENRLLPLWFKREVSFIDRFKCVVTRSCRS